MWQRLYSQCRWLMEKAFILGRKTFIEFYLKGSLRHLWQIEKRERKGQSIRSTVGEQTGAIQIILYVISSWISLSVFQRSCFIHFPIQERRYDS